MATMGTTSHEDELGEETMLVEMTQRRRGPGRTVLLPGCSYNLPRKVARDAIRIGAAIDPAGKIDGPRMKRRRTDVAKEFKRAGGEPPEGKGLMDPTRRGPAKGGEKRVAAEKSGDSKK